MHKKTKIICTLGPASDDQATIEDMVCAGMNIARLNFSHGSYENFSLIAKNIRKASKKMGRPVAILQDLQGPKIRIGKMPEEGVLLKKGAKITLTTSNSIGNLKTIPIQYKHLPKDVKKGHIILVNDGRIELKVLSKTATTINCQVVAGGPLTSNKGINVPNAAISANPLTEKDKKDLQFGLKMGIDFVALSFVRSAQDIRDLRLLIGKHPVHIVAKIERQEAIDDIKEIINEADAIMIARGDLGLEIPAEQVPIEQKRIIKLCNKASKPVIIATQMLDSMVEAPRATRAEISDIANAILDNTDCVMLSNESAVGLYPVRATKTLSEVAHATEKLLKEKMMGEHYHLSRTDQSLFNATCLSAAHIASDIQAKYIIAITNKGFTAREIAKHRAYIPIIAITPHDSTVRKLQIVWGVTQTIQAKINRDKYVQQAISILKKRKLIKSGDEIVICNAKGNNQDFIASIKI